MSAVRPAVTRAVAPRRPRVSVRGLALSLLMWLIAFVLMLPLLYTVSTAFKTNAYVLQVPPQFIPTNPTWQNFQQAWGDNNFAQYFLNSLKVAALSTVGTVLVAATGAYAFARLAFPFKRFVFGLYLVFLMIPGVLYIIPQFILARNLHLLNSLLGLVVFYIAGNVAFHTFLMRGFFAGIPGEIEEAAQVDGATRFQTFVRIALPLAAPVLGTSAIFAFLGSWDEFTLALTFINDVNLRTLPIAIRLFQGQHTSQWGLVFAASLIALVPVVLAYGVFQRLFIQSVGDGAIKG